MFLVESTRIQHFHAKLLCQEKSNEMSTMWTYHKERIFPCNYFILKILFHSKNLLQRVASMCQVPKCQILFEIAGVLFDEAFSL